MGPGDKISQSLRRQGDTQPPPPLPRRCILCGCPSLIGGGGDRASRLGRQEVIEAGSQLTAQNALLLKAAGQGGDGGGGGSIISNNGDGCGKKGVTGLLYGESASLRALCCWCVEGGGGGEDRRRDVPGRFPYAKAFMRGLTEG